MKALLRVLCIGFAFTSFQAGAANVAYKCTTLSGDISFLDKRPTEGCASIEVVNIGDDGAGNTVTPETAEDLAELDKKDIAARELKAKEECRKRKSEYDILSSRSQVIISDPDTGEKKALSQEEHQAKLRQYEEYLKTLCGGTGASAQ